MLTHKGWFTVLYMQHLLTLSWNFADKFIAIPYITPPPHTHTPAGRLVPSLGLRTTWVRQLRSGSCLYSTTATKCNVSRTSNSLTLSVDKHAHPTRVVYYRDRQRGGVGVERRTPIREVLGSIPTVAIVLCP